MDLTKTKYSYQDHRAVMTSIVSHGTTNIPEFDGSCFENADVSETSSQSDTGDDIELVVRNSDVEVEGM